jgi:glutamyl-tRNA synthetase
MALFNWLFARHNGGTFILRLEDTDATRTSEEFVQGMCEGFHWLGIEWDEGPEFGDVPQKGDYGPYRQSRRRDLHVREAMRLVEEGKAYRCYLMGEELEKERETARAQKRPLRSPWRDASAEKLAQAGDAPCAIRFKVPEGQTVIDDLVQGPVRVNHHEIDDFVLLKPNGDPIFHLAVVVDDGMMKVSHVIRGDDHLTNASRHAMLFDALGYDMPRFAHLPMVLDEKGRKYSKREHGANVLDWRADGYLPEALINYVALLGWTPEEENRELFTREELVAAFTADRLSKSAAKFDLKKLQWLNGQHMRRLAPEQLRDRLVPVLEKAGLDPSVKSPEWLTRMTVICQEKLATLNDIVKQADFFFVEPEEYEEKGVRKHWRKEGALDRMRTVREALAAVEPWDADSIKAAVKTLADEAGEGFGKFIHPIRLALTGKTVGPGLFELAELIDKDDALRRMDRAMAFVAELEDGGEA